MAEAKGALDYWRIVFGALKYDIFELIENAILLAAKDYPNEFEDRMKMIVENFYGSQPPLSSDGDQAEHQAPINGEYREKEKKSSDDSENLEEKLIVGEAMRINEVLCCYQDESILYESLSRSVEILKVAEIGTTMNPNIRKLGRTLVHGWGWVKSAAPFTQSTVTELGCSSSRNPNGLLSAGAKKKQSEEEEEEEDSERVENTKKQRLIHTIKLHNKRKRSEEEDSDASKLGITMKNVPEENDRAENAKKQKSIHNIKQLPVESTDDVIQSSTDKMEQEEDELNNLNKTRLSPFRLLFLFLFFFFFFLLFIFLFFSDLSYRESILPFPS